MPTRFSDDLLKNTNSGDFIARRHLPLAVQILLAFAIAFVAIYSTACVMYDEGSRTIFFITLTLSIGTLAWFTIYFSARLRDLVLATEFQNAMLASAAQLSTRFCLITKRDGWIVYVDPNFQKLFPHFMQSTDRNIDGMLARAGISKDLIEKIVLMLSQNHNDRILLSLRKDDGTAFPIMLSVDALPRPRGYFLLRGRDYVERRGAEAGTPSQSWAEAPLTQALHVLPDGILITDGSGGVTYVNRALEEWLGFEAGEMMAHPLKAGQIVYQYGGMDAGRLISSDFDGEVVLQRKDRSLVNMHIRQAPIGKSAGISAVISPSKGLKKK